MSTFAHFCYQSANTSFCWLNIFYKYIELSLKILKIQCVFAYNLAKEKTSKPQKNPHKESSTSCKHIMALNGTSLLIDKYSKILIK